MQITKISVQVKNPARVNLYVDDKFYRGLDRLVVLKLGLKTGLILNPQLLERLETTQSENSVWEWALRSLQVGPKSIRTMQAKLSQKYDPKLVEAVMQRLINAGLLDDQKLAEQLVNQLVQRGTKSRKEIMLKLRQKGIGPTIAKTIAVTTQDEEGAALNLARVKNRSLSPDLTWTKRFEKLAGYLARKGFAYSEIRRAVTPENLDLNPN